MEFDRTWSQFLLDSTIPTLLGRYNHRTSLDFVNRIVSIKRSTANLRDDEDDQTLINTVLQKVTQTIENESKLVKQSYQAKYTKITKRTNKK